MSSDGASRIGAAVCKSLSRKGDVIGIIDIDPSGERLFCQECGDWIFSAEDVGSKSSIQKAFIALASFMPSINGCVTPAGHNYHPPKTKCYQYWKTAPRANDNL